MSARRAYGGVSADQRREQRRAALLDAAREIIGTQGFSAMTVIGLCKAAGLNDRYFAENFDSREALFSALIDQIMTEMAEVITTATIHTGTADIPTLTRAAIAAMIEYLTDDPRRARIALLEAPANPVVAQRRREVMDFFLGLANQNLVDLFGPGRTLAAAGRLRFAGVSLFGAMMETITTWLAGGLPMTRDELIDHTADLTVLLINHVYPTP
ncbi:TetR/AcrR family transcriptional regulator [Nocardia arthritidis]|uniref:TetR family transcriptional regulator n=1 Tax=Nocardia arthritidis TaxID=228602 RepID=A0A6G9Y6E3_9NOCA|nr:TetR/AcrR family transcriptional regulator [Nocardia arthritidis]QIS08772.1 TetR family transcriptional regulator [Nocardia arthritidis]